MFRIRDTVLPMLLTVCTLFSACRDMTKERENLNISVSEARNKQETAKGKDSKAVKPELDKIREDLMHDQRKQQAAEALRDARAAEAEAEQMKRQLDALRSQSQLEAWQQNRGTNPASPNGVNSAIAERYYARIKGHMLSYWKVSDFKDWPQNLLATMVVTIDKSGKILDVQFEKRSSDSAFDRLVRKTLDDANPLPPIHPALKMEQLEFGCNFAPSSIPRQ